MKKAFTLIELLVVVAIIAILAAIAVPNFLNAMTRANVSRVKADMRTLATALETYRLDTNRYPPDATDDVVPYLHRLIFLTTPISYITSVPADPFARRGTIIEFANSDGGGRNAYADPPTVTGEWHFPLTYDYATRIGPGMVLESPAVWMRISRSPAVLWGIRSVGPDLWPAWLGMAEPPYDPTNGVVSRGNIYWTGPGIGEDFPRNP